MVERKKNGIKWFGGLGKLKKIKKYNGMDWVKWVPQTCTNIIDCRCVGFYFSRHKNNFFKFKCLIYTNLLSENKFLPISPTKTPQGDHTWRFL